MSNELARHVSETGKGGERRCAARAVGWLLGQARKKAEVRWKVGRVRLRREPELGWSWAAHAKIKEGREGKIKLLSFFLNTFSNPI